MADKSSIIRGLSWCYIQRSSATSSDIQRYQRSVFPVQDCPSRFSPKCSVFSALILIFISTCSLFIYSVFAFFPSSSLRRHIYAATMRRTLLFFLVVSLVIFFLLARGVWTLLSLLVEDGASDAIHRAELPWLNSTFVDQRPQTIPKIIHQTYKNETIPDIWVDAQRSCISLHPDYKYIVRPCLSRPVYSYANYFSSCGRTQKHANLLRLNILGSCRLLMVINILFSVQTRFVILFWRIMAEFISIWTTCAPPSNPYI